MGSSVRRFFFFAQVGLLALLVVMIVLDRPSGEMLVITSLALLSGIVGAVTKALAATRGGNLTLVIEDTSMPKLQILEVEAGQSDAKSRLEGPRATRGRRNTVRLRHKPDTETIRAIDDALERAAAPEVESPASEASRSGGGGVR